MKTLNPLKVKYLVIHCTATNPARNYTVQQLRFDHLVRGFEDIGYHYYVRTSGKVYNTRPITKQGAHVQGYNSCSIGIAYEGGCDGLNHPKDTINELQIKSIQDLLQQLKIQFPNAELVGHNDLNPNKACPCFSAKARFCI